MVHPQSLSVFGSPFTILCADLEVLHATFDGRRNSYYLVYSLPQNLKERERTGRKRTEIRIGIDEIGTRSAEKKTNGVETWRKTGTVIEIEKGTIKRKNEIRIGTGTGTGTRIETEIRSLTRPRTSTRNHRIRC